jgi:anti-sigma B factor antagonist
MTVEIEAKLDPEHVVELKLAGRLTAASAPALKASIGRCIARRPVRLVVDLSAVTALDATAIAALLDAQRIITSRGGEAMTLTVNPLVRRVLKESGTVSVFRIGDGPAM